MNGIKVLVDSDVVILLSRRAIDLEVLYTRYDEFYASIVTYIETLGYQFENIDEQKIIQDFFADVSVIDLTPEIAEKTIEIRKQSVKKIKLPDAVILATAKHVGAELLTNNVTDFVGIDPTVIVSGISDLQIAVTRENE